MQIRLCLLAFVSTTQKAWQTQQTLMRWALKQLPFSYSSLAARFGLTKWMNATPGKKKSFPKLCRNEKHNPRIREGDASLGHASRGGGAIYSGSVNLVFYRQSGAVYWLVAWLLPAVPTPLVRPPAAASRLLKEASPVHWSNFVSSSVNAKKMDWYVCSVNWNI